MVGVLEMNENFLAEISAEEIEEYEDDEDDD